MVYGLWLSADGMLAEQYRQTVIANNLANVDTPGFKPDRVAFAERLSESTQGGSLGARHPVLDPSTGGLFGRPVYTDYSQGGLIPSSNPLDVAVLGDGFLTIRTPEGTRYTRDGRLTIDANGTLRHVASGGAVVDAQGQPLVLDPSAPDLTKIDENGRVSQRGRAVGELAVANFKDPQQLEKIGQNLYSGDELRVAKADSPVKQFVYEASGAEPTTALVDMISATRAYEMNASLIGMQDESLGRLINEVGRIG
ncbi:MAG: flagellar hook-basal body protein [Phycisphaerales bacterium]|nr:flagellar hook-basal body protein [Phycisphaerales bacterium]